MKQRRISGRLQRRGEERIPYLWSEGDDQLLRNAAGRRSCPERLKRLCRLLPMAWGKYASQYVLPWALIVRMMGYDHYAFADGNGRTAHVIAQWVMLRRLTHNGFGVRFRGFCYSACKYARSFLEVEQDEGISPTSWHAGIYHVRNP